MPGPFSATAPKTIEAMPNGASLMRKLTTRPTASFSSAAAESTVPPGGSSSPRTIDVVTRGSRLRRAASPMMLVGTRLRTTPSICSRKLTFTVAITGSTSMHKPLALTVGVNGSTIALVTARPSSTARQVVRR